MVIASPWLYIVRYENREGFQGIQAGKYAYGRGNMSLQAVKLPISHNNVVGENTVLQLNILETGILTLFRGSEFISNSTSSRWRLILTHSCENTSLQNVSVENLQFSRSRRK